MNRYQDEVLVSTVIGTYNRIDYLKSTIATLRNELVGIANEIIVVDGGSTDGTIKWLVKQKDIITVVQHNRGHWNGKDIERKSWGYFMNLGFRSATGKYICMLSDDCLVVPGAINNALKLMSSMPKKNKVGQVAFYWRNWPEQTNYWVGVAWGGRLFVNHGLYLRKALKAVDFIDAENYSFYHADGDLSLRLWEAGYECIDSKKSFIEHYSDANTAVRASNLLKQREDWNKYTKRWSKLGKPKTDWLLIDHKDQYNTADKYWSKKKLLRRLVI